MKYMLLFVTLITSTSSFAYFCPANFNSVNVGDTMQQVEAACGKPDAKKESTVEPTTPQEWNYYVAVPTTVVGGVMKQQGTLRMAVVFDADGHVINLTVNGVGVSETPICGASIQLGNSLEQVKSACGEPAFVNKSQAATAPSSPKTQRAEWKYTQGGTTTTLIFENGKLVNRGS